MATFEGSAHPAARPGPGRLGAGWIGLLGLLVLWGLAAWIYQLTQGLIVTGMRDEVSWGLYICTFAFFVGLSAGGLIMASAAEVFGVRQLRPLSRLGVLTAARACSSRRSRSSPTSATRSGSGSCSATRTGARR